MDRRVASLIPLAANEAPNKKLMLIRAGGVLIALHLGPSTVTSVMKMDPTKTRLKERLLSKQT